MDNYSIEILNHSGFTKNYVVFMNKPQVDKKGTSTKAYTNAWIVRPSIVNKASTNVGFGIEIEAFWGTVPQRIGNGVVVSDGESLPVSIAQKDSVTFSNDPKSFGKIQPGLANSGSYQIVAESDFTIKDNIVFGMSKPTIGGIAQPVASFPAEPNETYDITPVLKYYVADGDYEVGEVIDIKKHSTNAAEIDFTGRDQHHAVVTQLANGSFEVKYY